MTATPLRGHVVVLAMTSGAGDTLAALVHAGAFVGVVSPDRELRDGSDPMTADGVLAFRADPRDPSTWDRIAPHLEQRLGPVDAVVADLASMSVVRDVFLADMRRRGRGDVVASEQPDVVTAVVEAIRRTH